MRRETVEQAIEDEEQALTEVIELLRSRVPWSRWPPPVRRALQIALEEPEISGTSAWQARVLRRHLFGPNVWSSPFPMPSRPTWMDVRRAERLRVDLPRLVPLRAGGYLVQRGVDAPRRSSVAGGAAQRP